MKPLSTIIVMLCIASSAPALAEDKAGASSLFKEGNKLRKLEKYQGALEKYQEAYRLYPSFKIQYNIALTFDKMGRDAEALFAYKRSFSEGKGMISARIADRAKDAMTRLRAKVAVVELRCGVDGARVKVNGEARGITPLGRGLYLNPGEYKLTVEQEGYQAFHKQVKVTAGENRVVTVDLAREQPKSKQPKVEDNRDASPHHPPEFTANPLAQLKKLGWSGSRSEAALLTRLLGRGYRADDILAAYRMTNRLKKAYSELSTFGPEMVETVAIGQKLRLGGDDLYWLVWDRHGKKRPLTQIYNQRIIGGRGPKVAGWVLAGVGAASFLAAGVLALNAQSKHDELEDRCGGFCSDSEIQSVENRTVAADAVFGVGGAVLASGITCLIVGYVRTSRWLPEGTLEFEPASKTRARAVSAISFSPTIAQGSAGLSFSGAF